MWVLVTGANGFVGSHLVEHLIHNGHDVRCLIRPTSDPQYIANLPVEIYRSTLEDTHGLARACSGTEVVLHLAGVTKAVDATQFDRVNRLGTESLLRVCKNADPPVSRFIFISSLAASGPSAGLLPQDESRQPSPVSAYGRSKLDAELAVHRAADTMSTVIIRPAAVYGPRDKDVFAYFKLAQSGWRPVLAGQGDQKASMIHVDDLCRLLLCVMEEQAAVGQTYFASDGVLYRLDDVLDVLSNLLGRRTRRVTIPRSLLRAAATMGGLWSRLTGTAVLLNPEKLREIEQPGWTCSIDKARRELGFEPQVPLRQGLGDTATWYKEHGWL